jgi:Uma2 family endonuclease
MHPLPPRASSDADGDRFVLDGVTWEQYVAIRDALDERPGVHITFLRGDLEIRSPSRAHEGYKKIIARLLELYVVVRGIRAHGFGSTTYRNQPKERGLEPDECYCIGDAKDIPDIALEVALSSGGLPKLEVYRGLGVPEVWFWRNERLELYALGEPDGSGLGRYQPIPRSRFLPDLDLDALARFSRMEDQADAAARWYEHLRGV